MFDLFPRLKERIKQGGWSLSGGEQQMLAIGRALMSHPSLLMLDEPSLGLAPIVIEQVFDRIVELNKRTGLGVLLVEQNSAMALEIASRAFVLETGSDHAVRTIGHARRRSAHPRGLSRRLASDRKLVQFEIFLNIELRIDEVLVQKRCDSPLHLRYDARQHRECMCLSG